ncbi:MAG: hypothetical protein HY063_12940 [Bacteroidetes bacterium]|nr:hypothetical protein [Bacteroidota bacterium]
MYSNFLLLTLVITLAGIIFIPLLPAGLKSRICFLFVFLNAVATSALAVDVLSGNSFDMIFPGNNFLGNISLRIDALSAWFILVINFTAVTGALYGIHYMKKYEEQKSNLSLHWISYILMHTSLLAICCVQNSLLFLIIWEVMTLSSFVLVIFEHTKRATLKAGINFLIQSHIGVLFLTIAFIWIASQTGSYDFSSIRNFTSEKSALTGIILFICFFFGFAFKAGFVPFHTWLPYAHPVAPSHISGVMSGIIIKMGIYGILRMLFFIHTDFTFVGYFILFISVISGIYGVMLAIVQHNLKKLLAYHSIENIGIIGIGIGLGCIGIGTNNFLLASLGFAGGLLHVLNHSLFKSLLFYCAGNVYLKAQTLNVEQLGGLIKRMPHTGILFLLSALAICGLPPFNGFVSEFLIYSGLFKGIAGAENISVLSFVFSVLGLALIGGLALLCFTKAFGIVFLGTPRNSLSIEAQEVSAGNLFPMYLVLALIISIGIFPEFFVRLLSAPIAMFTSRINSPMGIGVFDSTINTMTLIGICSAGFILLCSFIFLVRRQITREKEISFSSTWGCGYAGDAGRMQYTANSFIRSYRKLAKPVLSIHKKEKLIDEIFPKPVFYETHAEDKLEEKFIDTIIFLLKSFLNRFSFLQSGNAQHYVLYGVIFILLVIFFPLIADVINSLFSFLKNM